MEEEKTKKQNFFQFLKFALISCSAGLIEVGSFALMHDVLLKNDTIASYLLSHETLAKLLENEYGLLYVIALVLSVIWNFTINRKFTFKSAANVPIAMLKIFGYYLVFTPLSTIIGQAITNTNPDSTLLSYVVLGCTMLINMLTEFLFSKFVVYRNQEGTAIKKEEKV